MSVAVALPDAALVHSMVVATAVPMPPWVTETDVGLDVLGAALRDLDPIGPDHVGRRGASDVFTRAGVTLGFVASVVTGLPRFDGHDGRPRGTTRRVCRRRGASVPPLRVLRVRPGLLRAVDLKWGSGDS